VTGFPQLTRPAAWPFALAVLVPLAAVSAALVTQHRFDMQPCPWCVLQRAIFVAISLAALPGLLLRVPLVRKTSAGLALLLAACGISAALWQHFVAAVSVSCKQTLADQVVQGIGLSERFPEVFAAYASCAEAAAKLFGVPYEFYSLTLFVLLAALMATQVLARSRRR
jgi:disulfide bond formation protein DsbB